MSITRRQAIALGLAMAGTSALVPVTRTSIDAPAAQPAPDLAALFPPRFAGWRTHAGANAIVGAPQIQGRAYGVYDALLERVYVGPEGMPVMLSVAFGADQSEALQVHRPDVCYTAAGFAVSGIHTASIAVAGRELPVARLTAVQGERIEPITWWTVIGGRPVAGRVAIKLRRVWAGLRGETPTGILVRISSLQPDVAAAHALQARFVDALVAALDAEAQDVVLGSPA